MQLTGCAAAGQPHGGEVPGVALPYAQPVRAASRTGQQLQVGGADGHAAGGL